MITLRLPIWWMGWGITARPVGVWAPKGAASKAASYVNLAAPGVPDIAEGATAPTWDNVGGWIFNGTAYLLSGIFPPSDASLSVIVRFSDATGTGNHTIFGSCQSTSTYNGCVFQHSLTSAKRQYTNDGLNSTAGRKTSGVAAVCGRAGYFDGVEDLTWADAAQGMPTAKQIAIGCLNYNGTYNQGSPCKIQALAMYLGTFTAAQVKALTVAMQRL